MNNYPIQQDPSNLTERLNPHVDERHPIQWPDFLLFLGLFFGISFLLMYILVMILTIYEAMTENDLLFLVTDGYAWLLFDAIVFFSLFFCFKRIRLFTLQALDFSVMRKPKTYGLLLLSILSFIIIQFITMQLLGIDDASKQPEQLGFESITSGSHWFKHVAIFISIALLTPIKEELLFRGMIHRFLQVRHHFWTGFIVSSVIFGLMHTGFPVSAIAMGMILVLLYHFTNSLIPPIVLHMVWNTFASIVFITSSH